MKKIFIAFLSLVLSVSLCFAVACSNGLKLSHNSRTMYVDEVFVLEVLTNTGTEVPIYTSDNENVVTVKQTGEIKAVAPGVANVEVKAAGKSATCKITVVNETRVATLKLTNVEKIDGQYILPLGINDNYPITTQIKFDGAIVDGQFTYESADTDIATVDANGIIRTGTQAGETIIRVNGEYDGHYGNVLFAEILVQVSNVEWNYSVVGGQEIYPLAEYDGVQYKNEMQFNVTLTIGEKEVALSDMNVSVEAGDKISINGNVITAKKAGETYFELSYFDSETNLTHTRRQNIKINRIVDDRLDKDAYTVTRLENVSLSAFDIVSSDNGQNAIANKETQKVIDITEEKTKQIIALRGEFQGLTIGEKKVEIYNECLIVKANIHVIDYCVNDAMEFKKVLYSATNEHIELGDNIYGVGIYKHPSSSTTFSGVIDGKGYVVSDITFSNGIGLFGLCGGTIKNIAIIDAILPPTSAVLTNQSVGAGLKTDNVYIRVAKTNSVETSGIEECCGGLLIQVESGVAYIKNTIVEMYGIQGKNAGAIAGVWYGSTIEIENSYFITDGNAYGYKLGYTNSQGGWSSLDGTIGVEENNKGLDYLFANGTEFNAERVKENSSIYLGGFDSEIWNLDTNGVPTFKNDPGKNTLLDSAIETAVKGVDGEENVTFSKLDNEVYQMQLPEITEKITNIYACRMPIEGFEFNTTSKVLTMPGKNIARLAVENVDFIVITESDRVYKFSIQFGIEDLMKHAGISTLAIFELSCTEKYQQLKLPVYVGETVYNFKLIETASAESHQNGKQCVDQAMSFAEYDSKTNTITFASATINNVWHAGERVFEFSTENAEYTGIITILSGAKAIRTAEDASRLLSPAKGTRSYTVYLANDIDEEVVIENLTVYDNVWSGRTTIYGLGHKLSNVVLKGNGIFGELGSGVMKDIAIEISKVELNDSSYGIFGQYMNHLTLENVYIEAPYNKIIPSCWGDVTIKNSIFNVNGATQIIDSHSSHSNDNISNAVLMDGEFFNTYANGLPASFKYGSLKISDQGLMFNGKLVCAKPQA